jgi:hypothetical protein
MHDVNAAVIRHMSEYPFWTEKAKRGLEADIGSDGLKRVQEACDFASDQEDVWLHRELAEASQEVSARIRAKYPDLDEGATQRIVTFAAYSWK